MTERDAIRAEIDRLRIGASDMRQAAAGARHLAGIRRGELSRMHADAERALETGVVVTYARPFTKHGIGRLDADLWAPGDPDDAKLHRGLIALRNIRFAHTDKTDLRGTEDVFGTGHYSESWVPIADDVWPKVEAVADGLAKRFDNLAGLMQEFLQQLE